MDKFFDEYCSNANKVTTIEKIAGTDCTPSSQVRMAYAGDTSGSGAIVAVLGALLGLSMLLLAVVIIGWICTYVLMKRRGKSLTLR